MFSKLQPVSNFNPWFAVWESLLSLVWNICLEGISPLSSLDSRLYPSLSCRLLLAARHDQTKTVMCSLQLSFCPPSHKPFIPWLPHCVPRLAVRAVSGRETGELRPTYLVMTSYNGRPRRWKYHKLSHQQNHHRVRICGTLKYSKLYIFKILNI